MIITSSSNPRIKQIRKLRERKERQESGLCYLEGLRIVGEAIQQDASLDSVIVAPELLTSPFGQELVKISAGKGADILEVSADVFRSFALKEGPQGIAAVVQQRWAGLDTVQPDSGLWVALDAVADPGNLGTILRTADAIGGQGVILLDYATDPYDPTAVRASMGAVFCQKLVKAPFDQFALWKRAGGLPVVGASGAGTTDYHHAQYPTSLVLLMGSERQGLLDHHLQLCDELVRIPMPGHMDSLNLAVATAVILYEIYNHHRDETTQGKKEGSP
jgi:TrmH family RNA methyltransferase